ncbi:cytochrome P450 [Actinomadura madurae]|uniref:cytochrome P450 n=1 Tax=Actinomadura madurae TaxID=1993 RepID=UPI00399C2C22
MRTQEDLEALLLADDYTYDPYPAYAVLRDLGPVWFEPWRQWIIARHQDVRSVLRQDGKTFTAAGRVSQVLDGLPAAERAQYSLLRRHFSRGLLHSDPPDHTRLRRIVAPALTPGGIRPLEPRVRELVQSLLDSLAGEPEFDIVARFAFPLPATIVAELIGIPDVAIEDNRVWASDISGFFGNNRPSPELLSKGQESLRAARAFVSELAEARRACPEADLITRLASAPNVDDADLLNTCTTFIAGGHETTVGLITSAVCSLARFPEQEALLRGGKVGMETAIEEFLRFESPNQRIVRIATADIAIGGAEIRSGERVMLLLGAANRDESVFDAPDELNLARDPNDHLAFAGGVHLCAGAYLARMEGAIAIRALLDAYPRIGITDRRLDWARVHGLRMLKSLNVRVQTPTT